MTSAAGHGPRGRRDNGLDASEYAAAADVDPRVGEHLLDVLALAGIAAYLQPSADLHPVTRTTTLPNRPTDRLWVDRRHLREARDVIGRLDLGTGATKAPSDEWSPGSPGPAGSPASSSAPSPSPADRRRRRDDLDLDTAWQQILESWDAAAVEPPQPEPGTGPAARPEPRPQRRHEPIAGLDVPFDPHEVVRDPDEEGYVPPAPPPLPRVSRYTLLATVLIVVGLVVFLRPGLVPATEATALVLGMGCIVGGFGTLIWRLRDGLTDDDPGDGAVV